MPFDSESQRDWMWANKPEIARELEDNTPSHLKLPRRKRRKKTYPPRRKKPHWRE